MIRISRIARQHPVAIIVATALVLVLITTIGWTRWRTPTPSKPEDEETVAVTADTLSVSSFRPHLKAYGELRAVRGVELAAEVSGIVDHIYFESGEHVKNGTRLLQIRLNDDPAKLAAIDANITLSRANLARDVAQLEAQAVSQATVDADRAALQSLIAQANAQRALIAKKTVRAPFSGQVGLRQVDLGQYLTAGDPIASFQALETLFVDFNVPQQEFGALRDGQKVQLSFDAYPARRFNAVLTAIDSRLDKANRMVTARATLPNPNKLLRPGMFAVVDVPIGVSRPAILAPLTAITYSPSGDYTYVLEPAPHADQPRHVRLRQVKLGDKQGSQVVVLEGLRAGEQVVTAGQVKLRDGAAIRLSPNGGTKQ
ncbi:efflux RND transporter periplasmic adaptor subunit [Sphingomonas sp. 1185]|uniref:efflux RND transporter periplasmic adaptor subunit n=1 Tax=Sphingomonas sp. 1185 TaxID=3156411 RepID=UPI00339A984B